jgi:hypothetical protein
MGCQANDDDDAMLKLLPDILQLNPDTLILSCCGISFFVQHFRIEVVESVDFVSLHIYLNLTVSEKSWYAK